MHISAVTLSVNYGDFLSWTIPSMKNVFDRLVVVTSNDDKETQRICQYYWVECLKTDIITKNGKFNKGLGINLGFDFLKPTDYCVHLDSDIYLPPRFSEFIRSKPYPKDCIYGVDRIMIKGWDQWISFIQNPVPQSYLGSVWPIGEVGYRVVQGMSYHPIGYFQMFHSSYSKLKPTIYPTNSDTAADSDIDFSYKWPAEKRILIPEVFVYHLGSEKDSTKLGSNWNGRVTEKFGPKQ